ncbi:MAG: CHAP domain-containing protein [Myxococcota bacterium]|jgi:surface antigen|nr:CHAP domain-containing protein [Myxococcota bacterium]
MAETAVRSQDASGKKATAAAHGGGLGGAGELAHGGGSGLGGAPGGGLGATGGGQTKKQESKADTASKKDEPGKKKPKITGKFPEDPETGWGKQLTDCHGVQVRLNRPSGWGNKDSAWSQKLKQNVPGMAVTGSGPYLQNSSSGGFYQCAEFVVRYYLEKVGHYLGPGNGNQYLDKSRTNGLLLYTFPSPVRPQAGDLMVTKAGPKGHVGIVKAANDGGMVVAHQNMTGDTSGLMSNTLSRTDKGWQSNYWQGFRRKEGFKPPEGTPSPPPDEEGGGGDSEKSEQEGSSLKQRGRDLLEKASGLAGRAKEKLRAGVKKLTGPKAAKPIGTARSKTTLKVREQPSLEGHHLGMLKKGDEVPVLEQGVWYKILYQQKEAFSFGEYLEMKDAAGGGKTQEKQTGQQKAPVQKKKSDGGGGGGDLAKWNLQPVALAGAVALQEKVPGMRITSGQRSRAVEARAWAGNIVKNKNWMSCLWAYRRADIQAVQSWINQNWGTPACKADGIEQKLLETFQKIPDGEMANISNHFTGHAIDVAPGGITKAILEGLPNVKQVINEGDHWHASFKAR